MCNPELGKINIKYLSVETQIRERWTSEKSVYPNGEVNSSVSFASGLSRKRCCVAMTVLVLDLFTSNIG